MMRHLLCTDLDRTLIPNGAQPESSGARARFAQLVARPEVSLAYVSGRHRALIEQAIADYALPRPDFAIADVGTTVYRIDASGHWQASDDWNTWLAADWRGQSHDQLHALLQDLDGLRLQEAAKQACHKLSYYLAVDVDRQALLAEVAQRLNDAGVQARLVWSIDEIAKVGLLDVLPARAGKLQAIRFLMQQQGFALPDTVFAGDSGNDLDVLLSELPAILVANADAEVRAQARQAHKATLYQAHGGFLGMNGNYAAGILEGVAHYWPQARGWLADAPAPTR